MNRIQTYLAAIALVAAALAAGCAKPDDSTPRAVVTEAKEAPASTPDESTAAPVAEVAMVAEPAAGVRTFVVSPESEIKWIGYKVTGKHDGGFRNITGEIDYNEADPTASSVRIEIDLDSIWSDSDRLTGHLKTDDFFDTTVHPKAMFQSTSIAKEGDHYMISGNLNLHGLTKNITFPANVHMHGDSLHAESQFVLKRFDFDIKYAGKSNDLIRDEVDVVLNVTATPKM